MLVNPATGMAVSNPDSTVGGEAVMSGLDQLGTSQEQLPLVYDLLGGLPGAGTTSAWNMRRVSRTMTRGGVSQRRAMRIGGSEIGRRGLIIEGSKETFSPRRFGRMSRARMIDPGAAAGNARDAAKGSYSPFGTMSGIGNSAVRQGVKRSTWAKTQLAKQFGEFDVEKVDPFSRGTFGRMAAMTNIGNMSEKQLAKRAGSITASVMDLEGRAYSGGRKLPVFQGLEDLTHIQRRASYEGIVGSTIKGPISGNIAGYFRGAQNARMFGTEATDALAKISTGPFKEGVVKAAAAFGREGGPTALARFAGGKMAAAGVAAAGPVGTIMLIGDIMKLGGKIMGAAGRTIIDAGKSLMTPLNKGVMGNQFRDNSVAATARQRGVMAISNSRLNMRSVLGHEAAAMSAYYG